MLGSKASRGPEVRSVPGLLEAGTSVAVSERGAGGVQSDLSIRGSTFQQVLVTLDGLPLTDPQTAHHNMDLPFPPRAVEQITVIPGPGSALFGPAAFAGLVDLTPRRPSSSGATIESAFGTFDTWRAGVDRRPGRGQQRVNGCVILRAVGRLPGRHRLRNLVGMGRPSSSTRTPATLRLSVGHADKDFGARDFYASYPSRERTRSTVVDLAPRFELAPDWLIKAIVRYRRHEDEFILIEDDPSFYPQRTRDGHVHRKRVTLTSPGYALGRTGRRHRAIRRHAGQFEPGRPGRVHQFRLRPAPLVRRAPVRRISAFVPTITATGARRCRRRSPFRSRLGDALTWRASAARGIRPPELHGALLHRSRQHGKPGS